MVMVTPTIQRITILAHRGLLTERTGIAFGAAVPIQAWRLVVELPIGTMDHGRLDDLGQLFRTTF
jgi:hypothetical protein